MAQVFVNIKSIATDEDAWDDTALLQAYDDAIRGVVRSNKRLRTHKQHDPSSSRAQSFNAEDENQEDDGGQERSMDGDQEVEEATEEANGVASAMPAASVLHHIDNDLQALLQAYFDAGVALGRYMEKNKLGKETKKSK